MRLLLVPTPPRGNEEKLVQTYLLESKSSDLGNVAVVDQPGSNTSKAEDLDSSARFGLHLQLWETWLESKSSALGNVAGVQIFSFGNVVGVQIFSFGKRGWSPNLQLWTSLEPDWSATAAFPNLKIWTPARSQI